MTEQEKHIEFTKLDKMDEMIAMTGKLKEELNSNSLQMEQLSEDIRALMYAARALVEMKES
jgi:hypothetical protein